jgi:LPXTG-motif cell wall-anchored protein
VRRNFAGLFAVLATGALLAAGPVLAQSTTTTPAATTTTTSAATTTDTSATSGYTTSTPTVTTSTPKTTTATSTPSTSTSPTSTSNASPTSTVDATPVPAPTHLAFTGANAVWIILLGVGLAGIAVALLFVDRRSRKNR